MKQIGKLLTALMVALMLNIGGVFAEEIGEPPTGAKFDWTALETALKKEYIPGDKLDVSKYYTGDKADIVLKAKAGEEAYSSIAGSVITFTKTAIINVGVKVGEVEKWYSVTVQSKFDSDSWKKREAKGFYVGETINLSEYFLGNKKDFTSLKVLNPIGAIQQDGYKLTFLKAFKGDQAAMSVLKATTVGSEKEYIGYNFILNILPQKDNGGGTPPGKPDEGDPNGGKPGGQPIPNQPSQDPKQQPQAQKTNNKGTKSKVVKTADNTSIIAYSVAGLFSIVVAVATKKRLSANK